MSGLMVEADKRDSRFRGNDEVVMVCVTPKGRKLDSSFRANDEIIKAV